MGINGENDDDGVNSARPPDDGGMSEMINRIQESYDRIPNSIQNLLNRKNQAIKHLDYLKWMRASPNPLHRKVYKEPFHQSELLKNTEILNSIIPRLRTFNVSRRDRLNNQTVNSVTREYSDAGINGEASRSAGTQANQLAGYGLNGSWQEMTDTRSEIFSQIKNIRGQSIDAAGELIGRTGINEGARQTLVDNGSRIKYLTDELGKIDARLGHLKQMGEDPKSKMAALIGMGEKAKGIIGFNSMQNEVMDGKFSNLSGADIRKMETAAAEKLVKALGDLEKSAGKTKDELAGLQKNAEEASKEFKEIQEAKAAGAGGGGGNGAQLTSVYASAAAGLANTVANMIQTLGVAHPIAERENVAGYANIENQKYDMYRAALGGDMTARMNLAGWNGAQLFGQTMASRTNYGLVAKGIGGLAVMTAGGAQIADALTNAPQGKIFATQNTAKSLMEGAQTVAEGASIASIAGNDWLNNISSSKAYFSGVNASMSATKQLNHVSGFQAQQYRDLLAGATVAGRGLGDRAGSALLDRVGGKSFMGEMASFGLGINEASKLAGMGVQASGSMFSADQLLQAKRFENLGLGSAEENIGRMGQLSMAGANNPAKSLEKVLEVAVSKGLDSSKSQNMLVEFTGQMAEKSAMAGGPDVIGRVSQSILNTIPSNPVNQELATKQALGAFENQEAYRNRKDVSFHTMVALGRLQLATGLSPEETLAMQDIPIEELRTVAGLSEADAMRYFKDKGLNTKGRAFKGGAVALAKASLDPMAMTGVEGNTGMALGANINLLSTVEWLRGGEGRLDAFMAGDDSKLPDKISQQRQEMLLNAGRQNPRVKNLVTVAQQLSAFGLAAKVPNEPLGSGKVADPAFLEYLKKQGVAISEDSSFKTFSDELNRGNVHGVKAAIEGEGKAGGLRGVAASGTTITENAQDEKTLATAAAESAKTFGASAKTLDGASGKLLDAANALLEYAGLKQSKPSPSASFPDPEQGNDPQAMPFTRRAPL